MIRVRTIARRAFFVGVDLLQLVLVTRGYWSDHKEFAYQMFPEASTWRADIVRVLDDGERVPVDEDWSGYRWDLLVRDRGLQYPAARRHADAGVDNQLAFLQAALDYVATNTPRDAHTRYLEAHVTYWRNSHQPRTITLRSRERPA